LVLLQHHIPQVAKALADVTDTEQEVRVKERDVQAAQERAAKAKADRDALRGRIEVRGLGPLVEGLYEKQRSDAHTC
jgi:hypothetical protein